MAISALGSRTFVDSALGLAPLSGSCVCAYGALRFPGWLERRTRGQAAVGVRTAR